MILRGYRRGARDRGLSWELTGEEFDELTSQDCTYCGSAPGTVAHCEGRNSGEFTYNGLDRVDSGLGYTLENVVTCCQICNRAKSDLPCDEFMAWLGRLAAHQWFSPEQLPSRLLRGVA
jgi:hypothetical protein